VNADREKQLLDYIGSSGGAKDTYRPLVEQIVFLEGQLDELRALPFIRVHPSDPARQKPTPAARQYRELLSQYTACIKVLGKITGDSGDEDSPLRAWMTARLKNQGRDDDDMDS